MAIINSIMDKVQTHVTKYNGVRMIPEGILVIGGICGFIYLAALTGRHIPSFINNHIYKFYDATEPTPSQVILDKFDRNNDGVLNSLELPDLLEDYELKEDKKPKHPDS